ncbi:MAG: imidazole glycerol phosphate synthase subunit HisH [Patescibacteria group bacterium]
MTSDKKKKKIAIIDYKAGNLYSVQHACSFIGLDSKITSDKDEILKADGAILPGVGAFGEAMENIKAMELIDPIRDFVKSGKPFMGVCLGLQLLFSESEEFGLHKGLDLVKGRVVKFPTHNDQGQVIKVPQIGWNQIVPPNNDKNYWSNSPLSDTAPGEFMYFVHSFFVKPSDSEDILSLTDYEGIKYCSSIKKNNIFATQFHPEKSAGEGIKIYQNWAKTIK